MHFSVAHCLPLRLARCPRKPVHASRMSQSHGGTGQPLGLLWFVSLLTSFVVTRKSRVRRVPVSCRVPDVSRPAQAQGAVKRAFSTSVGFHQIWLFYLLKEPDIWRHSYQRMKKANRSRKAAERADRAGESEEAAKIAALEGVIADLKAQATA